MIMNDKFSKMKRAASTRRSKLLGSVAALGLAAFVAGAGVHHIGPIPGLATPAQAAEVTQPSAGFADLVAKVKPAVIAVRVKMDQPARQTSMEKGSDNPVPFQHGSPIEKFFRQFPFNETPGRGAEPHSKVTGLGSGFFISADGYAVTNNHVVDHASSVQVTTDDGKIYTAKVVGTDPTTDLALIKVDGKKDFPYVQFADHAPRIGDWVVAVGNPFGLGGTVTAGIVSANGRDIGSGAYDYMQIDAPINKGNSGGPAFDINGNVIGVNTAIFSPSGGSVEIGFDIPAETVKIVVGQLKDNGHVTGLAGCSDSIDHPEIAEGLGMKEARGP